jgi:poly-gamma-glutamate capsule biosynthesis protein CapA/YwtB (metallophosphatase superfamily)
MDDLYNRMRGGAAKATPRRPAPTPARPIPAPVQPRTPEPFFDLRPEKKKKRGGGKKKVFLIITLVLVLLIGGAAAGYFLWYKKHSGGGNDPYRINWNGNPNPPDELSKAATQQEQPKAEAPKTLRLVATGDMIAHSAILERGKAGSGYDFKPMLANMKPYFAKADVRFCNESTPAGGASFGYSGYPVFNAPLEWSQALGDVGCNVINIGTNHTNDKGQDLINAFVASWDNKTNIVVAGANRNAEEMNKVRYFEQKGVKFAFLSYSTYTNKPITNGFGVTMYSDALATTQITEARSKADIVLVSMRWGTEYSPAVNAQQDQIAQKLADLGADIVVGHGPHFMGPVKKLKGKDGRETVVWFSLGNFLNAQLETEALIGGFATMNIDTASKKVTSTEFLPTYMHYEWTPAEKAANNLLVRRNFSMYPLDKAAEPMSKSLIGTTVEAQTDRITKLLNQFTPVTMLTSDKF